MRVAYVINSEQYPYHKQILSDFESVVPGKIYDVAEWDYRIVNEIVNCKYNVVIFFDLAGHQFRTTSDTLTFNKLTCRVANILFRRVEEYMHVECRQNLSSFMYISRRDNLEQVKRRCVEVPNIFYFPEFRYKADSEEEHAFNMESVKVWWSDYIKEAMINEAADI